MNYIQNYLSKTIYQKLFIKNYKFDFLFLFFYIYIKNNKYKFIIFLKSNKLLNIKKINLNLLFKWIKLLYQIKNIKTKIIICFLRNLDYT